MSIARAAVVLALVPSSALAESRVYSFFDPSPAAQMRPMAVDEAAITLDPGHLQLEMDVAVYATSGTKDARTTHTAVMPTQIKVRVTSDVEAQLIVSPYERTTSMEGATAGYGSTTGRLKVNLRGNDGADTALALIPYGGNAGGSWFGGMGAVLGLALPAELGLTVVPQVTVQDGVASAMTTLTLGHAIAGDLAGTIESVVGGDLAADSAMLVQANLGLSYLVTPDVQLDVGGRRGVLGDVPDLEWFARISARR